MLQTPSYLGVASTNPKDGRKRSGIYGIINQARGHIYIGSSKHIAMRWASHRTLLRNGKHYSSRIQRAWNKYGGEQFQFVILAFCPEDDLITVEQQYIDALKPVYNMMKTVGQRPSSDSKNKGRRHSEEAKRKMRGPRPSVSGNKNPMFGVHLNGDLNPMWGRKKPETSEFNRRTKKGKTYEEMYGEERGKRLRERQRQATLARYNKDA